MCRTLCKENGSRLSGGELVHMDINGRVLEQWHGIHLGVDLDVRCLLIARGIGNVLQ